jgi:hypothetical protein
VGDAALNAFEAGLLASQRQEAPQPASTDIESYDVDVVLNVVVSSKGKTTLDDRDFLEIGSRLEVAKNATHLARLSWEYEFVSHLLGRVEIERTSSVCAALDVTSMVSSSRTSDYRLAVEAKSCVGNRKSFFHDFAIHSSQDAFLECRLGNAQAYFVLFDGIKQREQDVYNLLRTHSQAIEARALIAFSNVAFQCVENQRVDLNAKQSPQRKGSALDSAFLIERWHQPGLIVRESPGTEMNSIAHVGGANLIWRVVDTNKCRFDKAFVVSSCGVVKQRTSNDPLIQTCSTEVEGHEEAAGSCFPATQEHQQQMASPELEFAGIQVSRGYLTSKKHLKHRRT